MQPLSLSLIADLYGRLPIMLRFDDAPVWLVACVITATLCLLFASTWRSLSPLGPWRQWIALGMRSAVVMLLIFALAGAKWERRARDVEVIVLRDVSVSTQHALAPEGPQAAIDRWLADAAMLEKRGGDRIGVIGFSGDAWVEALPADRLNLGARPHIEPRSAQATDIASAIQLGMAMFRGDAMQRLVLVSDGNANRGDLAAALDWAVARRIPIDVLPLRYNIHNDVLVERLAAPSSRREDEPFSLDVVLRNLNSYAVSGTLSVWRGGTPMDLDRSAAGNQPGRRLTLQPGLNTARIPVAGSLAVGIHRFEAHFQVDHASDNAITANDSAEAFTVVRGKGRVLWVEGDETGGSSPIHRLLAEHQIETDTVAAADFPTGWSALQGYDAIVLDNVPRGMGGLDERGVQSLTRYVRDLGGGLAVIGGPDAFGAGGWIGSPLEQLLPVHCDIEARIILPRAALMIVLDRSGSMGGTTGDGVTTKQQVANEAAALAVEALSARDLAGVIAFDSQPEMIVPLRETADALAAGNAIRKIAPGGGTQIFPALQLAFEAMVAASDRADGARHILLVTDGKSPEPADLHRLIEAMRDHRITLSTVGIGQADEALLARLARDGGGAYYAVPDPSQLVRVFIREVRRLQRPFIHEQTIPVLRTAVADVSPLTAGLDALPPVEGMILTRAKTDPSTAVLLRSPSNDPLLAYRQAGLGRVAVFTSDSGRRWSANWLADDRTATFWPQLIRTIIRRQEPGDVDARTSITHDRGSIVVEVSHESGRAMNFASVTGILIRPDDTEPEQIRLMQTAPGRYETSFDASQAGAYIASLRYVDLTGAGGMLLSGAVAHAAAESRSLQSDDAALLEIVRRTGGRMLHAFDPAGARLFAREGLAPMARVLPMRDILLLLAVGVFLLDVANRRIAWDGQMIQLAWLAMLGRIREATTVRPVESRQTLDALERVRSRPNPSARFEAVNRIDGDLSGLVGGAPDKPIVPPARSAEETTEKATDTLRGLMAAKRRAQEQVRDRRSDK